MIGLLLSGGVDSTAIAWWKRPDVAITVDYGQKPAKAEIAASVAISLGIGIRHEIISIDCSRLGCGDMAGTPPSALASIPEWWPFRNQLILTLAGMAAVRIGIRHLMIGSLSTDCEHADGRPDFVTSISNLMSMQEGEISISAPAISMDSVTLVRTSAVPKEILGWTHSCHIGDFACGACRGCVKHFKTWESLGWEPY
jgi:7-cyano-7-deazaguanine synthase